MLAGQDLQRSSSQAAPDLQLQTGKSGLLLRVASSNLLPRAVTSHQPQTVGRALRQAMGRALRQAMGRALRQAMGRALRQAVGRALRQAVGRALRQAVGRVLRQAGGTISHHRTKGSDHRCPAAPTGLHRTAWANRLRPAALAAGGPGKPAGRRHRPAEAIPFGPMASREEVRWAAVPARLRQGSLPTQARTGGKPLRESRPARSSADLPAPTPGQRGRSRPPPPPRRPACRRFPLRWPFPDRGSSGEQTNTPPLLRSTCSDRLAAWRPAPPRSGADCARTAVISESSRRSFRHPPVPVIAHEIGRTIPLRAGPGVHRRPRRRISAQTEHLCLGR